MRLQTIEELVKTGVIMVGNSGIEMKTPPSGSVPRRILKGCTKIVTLSELCRAHEIEYCDLMEERLCFVKQSRGKDARMPANPFKLGLLPVERFMYLEILVSDFQEAEVFQFHWARCTGTNTFSNGGARNDWVWVQTGTEQSQEIGEDERLCDY